jgi:hypothetical protein
MTSKNDTQGLPLSAIRVEAAETGHGLDLDAIEARANAATPGPWTDLPDEGTPADPRKVRYVRAPNGAAIASFLRTQGLDPTQALVNGGFIAAAREDVPRMAKEIRRLEADSERLRLLVEAQEWTGYAECLGGDEGVCPWCGTLKVQGAFGKPPGSHEPDCPAFTPTGDVK